MRDTYEQIVDCLNEVGIIVDSKCVDIDLRDYDMDSLVFISFIVEVERKFNIIIPDEYLVYDNMQSLCGFTNLVESLMNKPI